jgi:hypothetical protein
MGSRRETHVLEQLLLLQEGWEHRRGRHILSEVEEDLKEVGVTGAAEVRAGQKIRPNANDAPLLTPTYVTTSSSLTKQRVTVCHHAACHMHFRFKHHGKLRNVARRQGDRKRGEPGGQIGVGVQGLQGR